MGFGREIEQLRRHANKAAIHLRIPEITLHIWHEGEEPPPEKPWQLHIKIESQGPRY